MTNTALFLESLSFTIRLSNGEHRTALFEPPINGLGTRLWLNFPDTQWWHLFFEDATTDDPAIDLTLREVDGKVPDVVEALEILTGDEAARCHPMLPEVAKHALAAYRDDLGSVEGPMF